MFPLFKNLTMLVKIFIYGRYLNRNRVIEERLNLCRFEDIQRTKVVLNFKIPAGKRIFGFTLKELSYRCAEVHHKE
ncbi:CLUMA_CG017445, isoform A [Clunio marinus]|uniref:CLUMA_CG017445, isoform A n=1 Tax=Clunio marinus TaxID=568069 RepID=A0A1J1IW69_9DIPT|nr:CLUMA_CG017445, isoform A [Clunio marinus]